jgi:prevent-host-death family protein
MEQIMTVKSEQARNKMRDILDKVSAGGEVVIERYDRPTAVVIGYAQWQSWRKHFLAMLDQRSAEMKAGDYVTFEEVEAELQARAA